MHKTRLEVPMLKKYLPAYQAPGLIEELKGHDRMRLIQEREARGWTALSAFRSTRDSPSSTKSKEWACGTSVTCDAHESVSRLTSVKKFILDLIIYYLKIISEFLNSVISSNMLIQLD